jgi:hypothetical protein
MITMSPRRQLQLAEALRQADVDAATAKRQVDGPASSRSTISPASAGGTPTVSAAPSIMRDSDAAPSATIAPSWERSRVRSARLLPRNTSSKAELSETR